MAATAAGFSASSLGVAAHRLYLNATKGERLSDARDRLDAGVGATDDQPRGKLVERLV